MTNIEILQFLDHFILFYPLLITLALGPYLTVKKGVSVRLPSILEKMKLNDCNIVENEVLEINNAAE